MEKMKSGPNSCSPLNSSIDIVGLEAMRLLSLVAQARYPVLNTKDGGIQVVWKMVSADTNGVIQCGCYRCVRVSTSTYHGQEKRTGFSVVLSEQLGTFTLACIPHWSDFHLLFLIFLLI